VRKFIEVLVNEIGRVLLGKEEKIKLALACLLADGHLLIEDLPGMGKTTLSHALAKVLGLTYNRVQFTSDMLPADILGLSIFDPQQQKFTFHKGAIFTQVLLADEINRTTPKTQSALLESMEERQVTNEGKTYELPQPFFVIATQNPMSQMGTYPLPESQLDRFLMRISLGYPDAETEKLLFKGGDPRDQLAQLRVCLAPDKIPEIKRAISVVKVSDSLVDYVHRLVHYTRTSDDIVVGLSPRGAMALIKAAKTWAFMHERAYVVPEDVQYLFSAVVAHRIITKGNASQQIGQDLVVRKILAAVPVVES
jgi:MoxR-like ATPase